MLQSWKQVCLFFVLFVFAVINVSAQSDLNKIEREVSQMLFKKDLRQAIKEAEGSSANDLPALFRRLSLYRRAAVADKYTSTLKQIITNSDFQKSPVRFSTEITNALRNPLFQDLTALQTYLQNVGFVDDIYGRLFESCIKQREKCDINGFDRWLEQQALKASETETDDNNFHQNSSYFTWIGRRIDWREKFGLDNSVILNQFVKDVRKNPADLNAALRYLRFLRSVQDINWLAETFTSEQAFDYYALGGNLSGQFRHLNKTENERQQIYKIAAQFLQKSLSLPFTEKDKSLMWSRIFIYTSIPPVVKNSEKQLRFWTKTALAGAYKNAGEATKAQPIVEELMNTDTSDIIDYKPSQLAGAVQMASGARAVESKILSEQGTRQNSYEYWNERVAYYYGRQENELMYDAYKQSFVAVPFDISDENSRYARLHFLRRFADFVEDKFSYYANSSNSESFSDQEKAKLALWIEAEDFLRNEFEKTKSNTKYSYELAVIITENRFKKLSDELLSRNPNLLLDAAKLDLLSDLNDLVYVFFKSETVPQEKKDLVFSQILKITKSKKLNKARIICEALGIIEDKPDYMARLVPILEKNLKIAEINFNSSRKSDENYSEVEGLKNKYIQVLFHTYLGANDRKSAEKLLLEKYSFNRYYLNYSLERLSLNAAKNGVFEDAARYWKMKANIDRNNLDNLSSLKRYSAVVENLREFYKKMKVEEPSSPIPEMALDILK